MKREVDHLNRFELSRSTSSLVALNAAGIEPSSELPATARSQFGIKDQEKCRTRFEERTSLEGLTGEIKEIELGAVDFGRQGAAELRALQRELLERWNLQQKRGKLRVDRVSAKIETCDKEPQGF